MPVYKQTWIGTALLLGVYAKSAVSTCMFKEALIPKCNVKQMLFKM